MSIRLCKPSDTNPVNDNQPQAPVTMDWYKALPRANVTEQPAPLKGDFKCQPEDFVVREVLGFELAQEGSHLWVHISKTGQNTESVQRRLQAVAKLKSVDVGYSGLKDKQGVTSQWFSLPVKTRPAELAATQFGPLSASERDLLTRLIEMPGLSVLEVQRHTRKLQRGTHKANQFELTLRNIRQTVDVSPQNAMSKLISGLQHIQRFGFPNYFGEQRFGLAGNNLRFAERLFVSQTFRPKRHQRGIYLSAARSRLFNEVCATRLRQGTWLTAVAGEPMLLDGARSFFQYDGIDPDVQERLAAGDVHTSGVLWGTSKSAELTEFEAFESDALSAFDLFKKGLEEAGLGKQRRALRARAIELSWQEIDAQTLRVSFSLESGIYATALLRELGCFTDCAHAPNV